MRQKGPAGGIAFNLMPGASCACIQAVPPLSALVPSCRLLVIAIEPCCAGRRRS